jgi:CheY-like chemotaxis protein
MRAPLTLLIDAEDVLVQPLLDAGYRVAHVETAHDALERLPIVSLVVTELDLPDRDGVVFVSELRERGTVPIVVCTRARLGRRTGTLALKFGADTVIDKPRTLRRSSRGCARCCGARIADRWSGQRSSHRNRRCMPSVRCAWTRVVIK